MVETGTLRKGLEYLKADLIIRWGFPDIRRIRARGSCSLIIVVSQNQNCYRSSKELT
jgi:hypothetical protein